MKEVMVNPDMIVLARESRGLTQSALASLLSITQAAVSKIESDLLPVSPEMLKELSVALEYPENFFLLEEKRYGGGVSEMGIIYHRKRKSIPIKTITYIQAQTNIRRIHISKLLRNIEMENTYEIPHYDIDEYNGKIQEIARYVRAAWRLPDGPIKNLTDSIESAGGIVIKFDFGTTKIDALSEYSPGLPPIFFINSKSPGDRLRFTLAHELGHIVMHRVPTQDMETEADMFASEFLMPSAEMKPLLSNVTLSMLANLKLYWKVSMASLLMKAHFLGKISEDGYRSLWIEMGKAGYKKHEPYNIPSEEPTTLKKIMAQYKNTLHYSLSDISHILALSEKETKQLYFQDSNAPFLSVVN